MSGFNYSPRLSHIYNTLAGNNLAKQNAGGMWYETGGVAIYQDGANYAEKKKAKNSGTDTYSIRAELNDAARRTELTQKLEAMFKDCEFARVDPPHDIIPLGPRS